MKIAVIGYLKLLGSSKISPSAPSKDASKLACEEGYQQYFVNIFSITYLNPGSQCVVSSMSIILCEKFQSLGKSVIFHKEKMDKAEGEIFAEGARMSIYSLIF